MKKSINTKGNNGMRDFTNGMSQVLREQGWVVRPGIAVRTYHNELVGTVTPEGDWSIIRRGKQLAGGRDHTPAHAAIAVNDQAEMASL